MIQHRAARFVLNKPWRRHHRDSITEMLNELNWPSLQERRKQARLILLRVLNKPWRRHHRDSITEMLNELNWPSLQERRKQARLILLRI